MPDWLALPGIALVILLLVALGRAFDFIGKFKALLPSRAKPRLLDAQGCFVRLPANRESTVEFELLVDNSKGTKDCSVISVKLTWAGGGASDIRCGPSSSLPMTVSAGQTESIFMEGYCRRLSPELRKINPLPVEPRQKSIDGTVAVKFNTDKTIEQKITFTIFKRS